MSNDNRSEDRDQQILRRLANIEHKVDSLDQSSAFALRANADEYMEIVKDIFGKGSRRAQIYLAANGQRSVQDIAELLGIQVPNVSRELTKLQIEALLMIVDQDGSNNFWGKKPIDSTFKISRFLMKHYNLNKDGLLIEK